MCESEKSCHNSFEPVTEIKDSRGVPYIVDLRDIVFFNPENVKTDYFRKKNSSKESLHDQNVRATVEEYKKLKLYIRKKSSNGKSLTVEEGQVESFVWKYAP